MESTHTKKYFYSDGTNNFGPFSFEEIKEKNITRETKVWFQELGEWKPAGEVPEFNDLFKLNPPPLTGTQSKSTTTESTLYQIPPKTWLLESILVTLFCCLPFGIIGIINASKVESLFYSGDTIGSNRLSAEAKKWTSLGFWIGVIGGSLYLIVYIIMIAVLGFSEVFK